MGPHPLTAPFLAPAIRPFGNVRNVTQIETRIPAGCLWRGFLYLIASELLTIIYFIISKQDAQGKDRYIVAPEQGYIPPPTRSDSRPLLLQGEPIQDVDDLPDQTNTLARRWSPDSWFLALMDHLMSYVSPSVQGRVGIREVMRTEGAPHI